MMHYKAAILLGLVALVVVATAANVQTLCSSCTFPTVGVPYLTPTPNNALALTNDARLWRSGDGGRSWNVAFSNAGSMLPSSSNPSLIYFLLFSLSFTTDAGQTFRDATLPQGARFYREDFFSHPTVDGMALLNGWYGPSSTDMSFCTTFITKDYGQTWTANFVNSTWHCSARWGNATVAKPDLIFLQRLDGSYGYSTDYKTVTKLFDKVDPDDTYLTRHYHFISVASPDVGEDLMWVSSGRVDPLHTQQSAYRQAEFPFGEEIGINKFLFLDDYTDSEFVAIHQVRNEGWATVYSSGPNGASYRLSVDEIYFTSGGIDFGRVHGVPGVYLANTIRDRSNYYYVGSTKVTFNNGGSWVHLQVPATNMTGGSWGCMANCRLFLVGPSSGINVAQSWHSSKEAIGVIIANGYVGTTLVNNQISTFLSRDGGVTFKQILPFNSYFALGNHGTVLVVAPRTANDSMFYSLDQGATFNRVQIVSTGTRICILGHPNGTGYVYLITGRVSTGNVATIWILDLTDVMWSNTCTDSDFEKYIPHDPTAAANCFMGAVTIYDRRKSAAQCYVPSNFDAVVSQTPCPCTYEDYECEFNYESSHRNITGAFTCAKVAQDRPCLSGQQYNKPTGAGYMLIPDSMCQGGLNLLGPVAMCPAEGAGTEKPKSHAAAVIIPLLLVAAIVVGVVVAYKKHDRFHDWVNSFWKKQPYGQVSTEDSEGLMEENN